MKLANTSFIQTSLNQRIVTRSPNHMCDGLVGDDAGAIELLVLRCGFVEQQRRGVVEDRASVLHPAELKRRDQHDVELAERVRDGGVPLEPFERRGVQIEDRIAVPRHFGRVRLAVEHPSARPLRTAVSRVNLPATNANRYVGSGCVSANWMRVSSRRQVAPVQSRRRWQPPASRPGRRA